MPTPNGWCWVRLTDVARLESGHTPSREHSEYWNGDVPWIGIKDARIHHGQVIHNTLQTVTEEGLANSAARWLPAGTVCLSRTASVGYVTVLGRAMATSQDFVNWVCSNAIDPMFLMHLLLAEGEHILKFGKGSTHTTIYFPEVMAFHVCIPPVPEQRRIVAKIEALTAKSRRAREALNAIPALLERFRQSVLAAAFSGDLTADWREKNPDVEPAEELLARTPAPGGKSTGRAAADVVRKGRFAISVGDSETETPDGWRWTPLSRIARMESGHTPSREHATYWGGQVPWIGIKDARNHHGGVIHQTLQTVTEEGLVNSAARLLPASTVCLSRTASVGYVTIMGQPMATSQDFANWICTEALDPRFLMYALLAEGDGLKKFGEGSTHTTIYFPELKALHIALPPLAEQREIIRMIEHILTRMDRVVSIAEELRTVYGSLEPAILAKAFRGELVPQDPNDEPASVLLERLRTETAQNGKPASAAGRRRAAASPPPAQPDTTGPGKKPQTTRRSQAPARSRG